MKILSIKNLKLFNFNLLRNFKPNQKINNTIQKNFSDSFLKGEKKTKIISINRFIKDKDISIYNTKKSDSLLGNYTEPNSYGSYSEKIKENEFEILKMVSIKEELSEFLKSLEFARVYNLKHNKYLGTRSRIPILNNDVKKNLSEILMDPQIINKKGDVIISETEEMVEFSQSYENILDENFYGKFVRFSLEYGKFFLKNDIYSIDHIVKMQNVSMNDMYKLSQFQLIFEYITFSELNNDQFLKIFPVLIIINNLFEVSEKTMELLVNETVTRLFSPNKILLNNKQEELFKSYFLFMIVNNLISNSLSYFKYLIIFKDIMLRNSDVHDLLYLIIDNIFKFVNTNSNEKLMLSSSSSIHYYDPDSDNRIEQFEEFLNSYFESFPLLKEEKNFDLEIIEKFFYSLIVLNEHNSNMREKILSMNLISSINKLMYERIFNKGKTLPWMINFLERNGAFNLLLEVENLYLLRNPERDAEENFSFLINDFKKDIFSSKNIFILLKHANKNYNQSSSIKCLLNSFCEKIKSDLNNKSINEQIFLDIISCLGKFKNKYTRVMFDIFYENFLKSLGSWSLPDLSKLLILISKYNLLDTYENNPALVSFNLKINKDNYRNVLFDDDDGIELIWALSFFALKSKEFNPIVHSAIDLLYPIIYNLMKNLNNLLSFSELYKILQILSVVELLMKFNIIEVDYSKKFNPELISYLMTVYLEKIPEKDNKFEYISNLLYSRFKNFQHLTKCYSNLDIVYRLEYMENIVPIILVSNEDFNSNDKLHGDIYIKYNHIKSYTNIPPMIVNVDKIKKFDDLDKEFIKYKDRPKTAYKIILD